METIFIVNTSIEIKVDTDGSPIMIGDEILYKDENGNQLILRVTNRRWEKKWSGYYEYMVIAKIAD